jgi:transposase-like protein
MAKRGAPVKLAWEYIDIAEEMVESGASDGEVAARFDVARGTYQAWLKRGRDGHKNPIYKALSDKVDAAKERRPLAVLRKIHAAGGQDWRAYDSYLKQIRSLGSQGDGIRKAKAEADLAELKVALLKAEVAALSQAGSEDEVLEILRRVRENYED